MQNTYASSKAFASLSGTNWLPTLKVSAASGVEGRRAGAGSFGVQGYSYSGESKAITLNFNLHGSVANNFVGDVGNYLSVDIAILKGSSWLDWYPDFATLVYEVAAFTPGIENVGMEALTIYDGNDVNLPGSISFNVDDGDDFFIVAALYARSRNGGYADGWNTLTMTFDDASGLLAATTVPVPAAAWLFGSGILALVGIARRKKNRDGAA